eukprot:352088-Chlamydomonas_euryale.AAC.14
MPSICSERCSLAAWRGKRGGREARPLKLPMQGPQALVPGRKIDQEESSHLRYIKSHLTYTQCVPRPRHAVSQPPAATGTAEPAVRAADASNGIGGRGDTGRATTTELMRQDSKQGTHLLVQLAAVQFGQRVRLPPGRPQHVATAVAAHLPCRRRTLPAAMRPQRSTRLVYRRQQRSGAAAAAEHRRRRHAVFVQGWQLPTRRAARQDTRQQAGQHTSGATHSAAA